MFTLLFAVAVVPEDIKNRGDFLRDDDIRIVFPLVIVSVKDRGDKTDDHKARKEKRYYSDQTHTVHLLHGTKGISLSRFPFLSIFILPLLLFPVNVSSPPLLSKTSCAGIISIQNAFRMQEAFYGHF